MLALLWACAVPEGDRVRYLAALRDGSCADVGDVAMRDDCWVAHVERTGEDACERIEDPTLRGECVVQLAERRKDASLCPRAAPFADDCALHVLSAGFGALTPARPGEREEEVAARIEASGLAGDDMRPWSAWYRWTLGGMRPLDRGACAAVSVPARREACERTGVALYDDLLNRARDTRSYPCDGGPLPPELQHTPDAELEARRTARQSAGDLCGR